MVRNVLALLTLLLAALLVLPPLEAQQGRAVPGTGEMEAIVGADPAAGAEPLVTVPAGFIYRLVSMSAVLVTDATVATREPKLIVDDGAGTNLAHILAGGTQAASRTVSHHWALGAARVDSTLSNQTNAPAPAIYLRPGYRIRTLTANLQAGDNYGVPVLYVERFRN